jgi:hypothetical protein
MRYGSSGSGIAFSTGFVFFRRMVQMVPRMTATVSARLEGARSFDASFAASNRLCRIRIVHRYAHREADGDTPA